MKNRNFTGWLRARGVIGRVLSILILCIAIVSFAEAQTRVIANWDMVPFQIFDSTIRVGVVAFHESGVHVEFQVNGLVYADVAESTYNPDTRVFEYWIQINASDYPDGVITLSAIAQPNRSSDLPRNLGSLVLYANSKGSLTNSNIKWVDCASGNDNSGDGSEPNPYRTIEYAYRKVGNGGTVYLKAGNCYQVTSSSWIQADYTRWTTITSGPGVDRSQILIGGYKESNSGYEGGRFGENFVHWKNVTLYSDNAPGYGTVLYFESGHKIWLDGVDMYDKRGRWNGGVPYAGNEGYQVYMTDSRMHDFANAGGQFMRNVEIYTIGSDIYRPDDGMLGVNVTVDGIDPGDTDSHPDFVQFYNPGKVVENVIVYNNRGINLEAQGLFGQDCKDVAFVNLLLEKDPPDSYAVSQFGSVWEHILLWHVTTVDSGMIFVGNLSDKKNWNIQDNCLASLDAGSATGVQDSVIDHNLFRALGWDQENGPMGTNALIGDAKFVSVENDNYRITKESPAYRSGVPIPGLPADIDGHLYDSISPSLGAFEYYEPPTPTPVPTLGNVTPVPTAEATPTYKIKAKVQSGKNKTLMCELLVNGKPGQRHVLWIERKSIKTGRYQRIKRMATDRKGVIKYRSVAKGRRYRCVYPASTGVLIYSPGRIIS